MLHIGIILDNAVTIRILSHWNQRDTSNQVPCTHTRCQNRLDDG
jgi:hypothetical protein